ncbi:fibronectin type III domain-containing protein [Pseudomonas sp. Z2-11]
MFKTTGSSSPEPLAPRVTYTPQTSTSVLLEWTFEAEGMAAAGARITINGDYHSDVFVPKQSLLLEGLVVESEYTITVIAYTTLAVRISEAATFIYVPKDLTPPSVPRFLTITDDIVYSEAATSTDAPKGLTPTSVSSDLRASENGLYSVTLEWEPSTDDIGMHGYVIYNNHEYCDDTPLTQYTATHLYAGLHLFHVRALDIHGNASEPAVRLVKVQGDDAPGIPIITDLTDTSVTLAWAPSRDGVSYRTVRWGNGMVERVVADTQCTYTELSTGSRYLFVVRAEDAAGNRSIPREVMFKTKGPASGQEIPAPRVTLNPQTSSSALLQWEYETGDTVGMRITVNGEYHSDVSRPLKTKMLKNLLPGVSNTITVMAYTILAGDLSEPTVLVHTPQLSTDYSPESLRVTASAPGSVTLVWDELEGGSESRGYLLYNNQKHVGSTLGARYTVGGLSPGLHSFSLRSLDLDGNIAELTTIGINVTE